MKKPLLSRPEALKNPRNGLINRVRSRMRSALGIMSFATLSSVAGCAINAQDLDWQQYRNRTDGDVVTPDSGMPEEDGGMGDTDSGPAPCLPAGDAVVSSDNLVNLSDTRNSVSVEIPFTGNCDALGETMLSFELNDGLSSRQNRPVLQVDNVAHMVRARLDLSTIMSESSVTLRTEMAGSTAMGRFNVDFLAPMQTGTVSTGSLGGGPYSFRATFNSRGRLFADFLRDSDEIGLVSHGDTTTACTTSTEASDCSMAAPDGSGRTQGCSTSRMPMLPVPARACDIREGRMWEYASPGADTLFTIHDRDTSTLRSAVSSGQYFKLRLVFIDDAGNAWINIYRVPRD